MGCMVLTMMVSFFYSEKIFLKRAKKINNYLKDWGAVGFRAPSMIHNLEWIGGLDILYDMSTFDTDPFQPQPDGVGTIFPFWVKNNRHKNGGYIELPYTISQDHTPFIMRKDKTNNIWTEKLDWIVKNKGMALINVHPDYMNLNNTCGKTQIYPAENYINIFRIHQYKLLWKILNVLPKEIAQYSLNILKK